MRQIPKRLQRFRKKSNPFKGVRNAIYDDDDVAEWVIGKDDPEPKN
jgi:hypothetical protein